MSVLLLLIFLGLVFFLIIKFAAAFAVIVVIVAGTTTVTTLACVWLVTWYFLKTSGYKSNVAEETYRQIDSDLQQIVGGLREIRSELEDTEPYLRDIEFLKYARQNRKVDN